MSIRKSLSPGPWYLRSVVGLTPNRKESIQKTIMAMTLGKDVSALFPDVLKNIATADLEQKKLVYLYLM